MRAIVPPGAEIARAAAAGPVARHHHLASYAALVLAGGYLEAGDKGRFRARAGDVLLHDGFEAHQDYFGQSGADILNLRLSAHPGFAFGRVDDADAIVREAERDPGAACDLLLERLRPADGALADWPDLLAADLADERVGALAEWGHRHGLAPSSVSRGFGLCYGISPQRFRLELRAASAARAARRGRASLARVAAECAFADQAHMSRTLRRLYGQSPSRLRCGRGNCT